LLLKLNLQDEAYQQQMDMERQKESNHNMLASEKTQIEREKLQTQKEIADKQLQIARENKNKFDSNKPTNKEK